MSISRHFVLAAGGTGGHMIPAHAVAQELMARGHHVALVTDERGAKIPGIFEAAQVHVLPAGRMTKSPLSWPGALRSILAGRAMARRLHETFKPTAVVGFGGYPAMPALLAAMADGIPTAIHEQNAVLGRVNRFAARRVAAIATAYPDVARLDPRYADKLSAIANGPTLGRALSTISQYTSAAAGASPTRATAPASVNSVAGAAERAAQALLRR